MADTFSGTIRVAVFSDPYAADITVSEDTPEPGRTWARRNHKAVERALWSAVCATGGHTSGHWEAVVEKGRVDAVAQL